MKNKIPPPILTVLAIAAIWAIAKFSPFTKVVFPYQNLVAYAVAAIGIIILVNAGILFKSKKTTVNPFAPQKTSAIVGTGIYKLSRNPMYLGMLLVIIAAGIWSGAILSLAPILIFFIYITRSQILPEEKALEEKFGQAYLDYKSRVRRWI